MKPDIKPLLESIDHAERPPPASDRRIKALISNGLAELETSSSPPTELTSIRSLEMPAPRSYQRRLPPGLLLVAATLLIAVAGLAAIAPAITRNDQQLTVTPGPSSPAPEHDTLDPDTLAQYCMAHITPLTEELDRWKGTFNYLFGNQTTDDGPLEQRLREASAALSELDSTDSSTEADVRAHLNAARSQDIATASESLQAAIQTLASHVATLPGASGCAPQALQDAAAGPS